MTTFQKAMLGVVVVGFVLIAVVIALVARQAGIDAKRAECDRYEFGSVDYFVCLELVD
jgi:hypothetical protein